MNLEAKPKAKKGRPKKYLNPDKAFEWFDEDAWKEANAIFKEWEEEYEKCKLISGTDHETLQDYELELREEYPQLDKLEISQVYIVAGKDKESIREAYRNLESKSKPPTDKETYTVRIPAERANEYSQYLAISEAFNNIRAAGNTNINTSMLPRITSNRIILEYRSMKLMPNPYLFTQDFK